MFGITMRLSRLIALMPSPWNSTDAYNPPSAPTSPMNFRQKSFDVTPGGNAPLSTTLMLSGTRSHSSPVAHSAATSLRPMPAPNAPIQP